MMWHWQQWFTAILYLSAIIVNIIAIIAQTKTQKRFETLVRIIVLTFLQWVLFSGGWYS